MSPVRLGLVGFGRWGRVLMANMEHHPQVCPAALASRQADAPVPPGCHVVAHWRQLLEMELDGLVVAAPPAVHAEIALAAMERALPLLIEKPLTLSVAEAQALAAAGNGLVMVDHIHLFSPAWRRLKQLAPDLGPVRSLAGVAGNHGPYRADTPVLWDWGAHDVAMMLDLLGGLPDRIRASRAERRQMPEGVGETIALSLDFGTVTATATLSALMDKARRFTVTCENGTLVYDGVGPVKLALDGKEVEVAPRQPLEVLLDEFASAIRSGSRDRSGLDLGVRVVEVLAACEGQLP
ncbi:MAG: Gfo/Idh/MocA family oxidoreductase [Magnetospirillum sp.]|nr:Gfo/Idh/MocA family oxidoreductase [Magnetospirillum sp.]